MLEYYATSPTYMTRTSGFVLRWQTTDHKSSHTQLIYTHFWDRKLVFFWEELGDAEAAWKRRILTYLHGWRFDFL